MQLDNIINISAGDKAFPEAFKLLFQPVKRFYALGNLDLLTAKPRLGIVGSRKITSYGREVTTDLGCGAARAGAVIVSGLALGVDAAAHKAALDVGGYTIAVLPSGLRNIYPASNEYLARQILGQNGLLISEFEEHEHPMKYYFIQRNRLVAAISETLLVTEAAMGSGTRHTVEFTIGEGKEVIAVPGDINKHSSSYSNYLIQNGCKPVFSTGDLLSKLGLNENLMKPKYQPENEYEKSITRALTEVTLTFNELLETSKLGVSTLNIHLTMLEVKGAVESTGNRWRLI